MLSCVLWSQGYNRSSHIRLGNTDPLKDRQRKHERNPSAFKCTFTPHSISKGSDRHTSACHGDIHLVSNWSQPTLARQTTEILVSEVATFPAS